MLSSPIPTSSNTDWNINICMTTFGNQSYYIFVNNDADDYVYMTVLDASIHIDFIAEDFTLSTLDYSTLSGLRKWPWSDVMVDSET